jgi:hypothetical protein
MPLELGVWRIDGEPKSIPQKSLELEQRLEELLDRDISIANPSWMVIGRQIDTGFGPRADLLAIDETGNLIVLELKRDQTPRDVVAQVLEYGAWVTKLRSEDVPSIYASYLDRYHRDRQGESFDQAFCRRFRLKEVPEDLNSRHELVIVATQFDAHSERIVRYLAEDHGVAINAIFFRVFADEQRQYLSRVWLRDPSDADADAEAKAPGEWNGEYYVSFGGGRNWEEARQFGFISGGGGPFYSRTLQMLSRGDRVWVNIPGTGYVGVGRVIDSAVPVEQFTVPSPDGNTVPISDLLELDIARRIKGAEDVDAAEYLVRVRWDKAVPLAQAVKERGFFGTQHTVSRPKDKRWAHTIERLRTRFDIAD